MTRKGFGSRWQDGSLRARAANVAEMRGVDLDGPGAEKRLRRIQTRFRRIQAKQLGRGAPPGASLKLGFAVFALVVFVGVVATFVLPLGWR